MDYRDHRPHLNAPLFQLLASGIGLRQSARNLGLTRRNTTCKFRKIARHVRRLNINIARPTSRAGSFHFDEFESYEGRRNTRPVTIPLLIESASRYIVWSESASIRPRGKMTKKRLEAVQLDESRYGRRVDGSRHAIQRTLRRAGALLEAGSQVSAFTDEKVTYPRLLGEALGHHLIAHHTTNSRLPRESWNPLFPINHEEAILRDLLGRVRRESWLVSKGRRYLDLGLQLHAAHRNLVRRRFNYDEASPAQLLGLMPRRLTTTEVLSWSQGWGRRSPHPLSRSGESIERWQGREVLRSA